MYSLRLGPRFRLFRRKRYCHASDGTGTRGVFWWTRNRVERNFLDAWNQNQQLLACATSKVAFMC